MKKILLIALVGVMAVSLFCGFTPARVFDESGGTSEAAGAGGGTSPTTGLQTTSTYKPVFVMIDNATAARPQSGIQSADVVYETPGDVDDLDTRLAAVFNDAMYVDGAPEKVVTGAVRSIRYYHQWIQGEWDALLVHMGGPDETNNPESDIWGESGEHVKQRINGAGAHSENADMFFENDEGDPIEDFAMTDVVADEKIYDYEPTMRKPFLYSTDTNLYSDMPQVDGVKLSFSSNPGWVEYRYDSGTNKFTRYMSGEAITDKNTGNPVEVQNVVIQYVSTGAMPGDPPRRQMTLTGEGPAEFYINGRHMTGTWERPTYDDITTFKLDSGDEVTFAPGNTWIAVHPNDKPVVTTYADGTESVTNEAANGDSENGSESSD